MTEAERSIRLSTDVNFRVGGYSNDGTIKPWSDRYGWDNKLQRQVNLEGRIPWEKGNRTGRLKRLTSKIQQGKLTIGSNAPYAEAYQKGGPRVDEKIYKSPDKSFTLKNVNYEARPFLGYGEVNERDVEKRVDEVIKAYLDE
jgi:phage gpG-like protein